MSPCILKAAFWPVIWRQPLPVGIYSAYFIAFVLLSSYSSRMKQKASISVSKQLLEMIDKLPKKPSRSEIIEEALILYFRNRKTIERDRTDMDILNKHHKELNEEALEVLDFQSGI